MELEGYEIASEGYIAQTGDKIELRDWFHNHVRFFPVKRVTKTAVVVNNLCEIEEAFKKVTRKFGFATKIRPENSAGYYFVWRKL